LPVVLSGTSPREVEVEATGTTVRLRVIPLVDGDRHVAGLVLCRDVTEVRRRERELVSKDATIREIHHRVKNNLQTVAALLRLQGRRLDNEAARSALEEAQRRVASIALVHETLARAPDDAVSFDEVADRVIEMVTGGAAGVPQVQVRRAGTFGRLPPEVATALALVLVELLQNATEHGLGEVGGNVEVVVRRDDGSLVLVVEDDGAGLPPDFQSQHGGESQGLGLQIVTTLVEGELSGGLTLASPDPPATGCIATVSLRLPPEKQPALRLDQR
jgi:two-component sensor histidine kinase